MADSVGCNFGSYNEEDEYMELICEYPLKPITSEASLDEATEVVDKLLDRDDLSTEAQEYLDVLTQLIETYELSHHAIGNASDSEVLKHLMDARGVKATEVALSAGIAESTLSAIVNGSRRLTRDHIGKLMRYFNVPAGVFDFPAE